jgi:transcriptional regulator of arginine metabolism
MISRLDRILLLVATHTLVHASHERVARGSKRARQRAIRDLVRHHPVSSQQELVTLLAGRGFGVTQATVSRDIAELGLVKVARAERHVYATPEDLAHAAASDAPLLRLLADLPVEVRRSGLTLLLITNPGMASALSQAIDESTVQDQEGTLAGENTVLVLFADEERLERFRATFERLRQRAGGPARSGQ